MNNTNDIAVLSDQIEFRFLADECGHNALDLGPLQLGDDRRLLALKISQELVTLQHLLLVNFHDDVNAEVFRQHQHRLQPLQAFLHQVLAAHELNQKIEQKADFCHEKALYEQFQLFIAQKKHCSQLF